MPRRRAEVPEDGARHLLAVPQAVFRQRALPRAAFHPDGREAASRHQAPALQLGQGLEPLFLRPAACQGVRPASCQVLVLLTVRVSSEVGWASGDPPVPVWGSESESAGPLALRASGSA